MDCERSLTRDLFTALRNNLNEDNFLRQPVRLAVWLILRFLSIGGMPIEPMSYEKVY